MEQKQILSENKDYEVSAALRIINPKIRAIVWYRDTPEIIYNENNTIKEPTEDEIDAAGELVKEEIQRKAHIELRKKEYPPTEVQLGMIYHDKKEGTNRWVEMIDSIRSKHPNPNESTEKKWYDWFMGK